MRPLRLSLQAFGSYGGSLDVDFGRLGRHGIFAITGPTGAGKSTIFDALVYALYDDLPGFREDGSVRSQFADPATETFVRLEFEIHGEEWCVERHPAQPGTRRRGGGAPVLRPARAAVRRTRPEGPALTHKRDVAGRIHELVGLTKDQFEQVVLIPQGRFEEVLKSDTATRAPLLRQLFPVDVYRRITDALKALAGERQHDVERAEHEGIEERRRLADLLAGAWACLPEGFAPAPRPADPADLSPQILASALGDLAGCRTRLESLTGSAGEDAEAARARAEAAIQLAERFDRWQADTAAAAGFAEEEIADSHEALALDRARHLVHVAPMAAEWQRLSASLGPLLEARAAAAAAVAARWPGDDGPVPADAAGTSGAARRVARQAEELEAAAHRHDVLAARSADLDSRRGQLSDRRAGLRSAGAGAADERRALDGLGAALAALAGAEVEADRARGAEEATADELGRARRREAAEAALAEARAEAGHASAAAAAARAEAVKVRRAWRDSLAARLGSLLLDGEPCPTCGSTDHPKPAVAPAVAADDDALAVAESAADAAASDAQSASRRVERLAGALSAVGEGRPAAEIEADLAASCERVRDAEAALSRRAALQDQLEARSTVLAATMEDLHAEDRRLSQEEGALSAEGDALAADRSAFEETYGAFVSPAPAAAERRRLAAGLEELATVSAAHESAERAAAHLRELLRPALRAVGVADPGALAGFILEPQDLERRQHDLTVRQERRRAVRDRLEAYAAGGGPIERPATEPLELAAKLAAARHVDLVSRLAVLTQQVDRLADGPSALRVAANALGQARRACEQARTVADRCAGAGGGPSATRLSLENWVLADYLRQVLVQANARLEVMTAGRYGLALSDGVTDGRKSWGLDLSVSDAHTGQVRPATTLSGGETFMAALALALGLADVVSGGSNRRIRALFIDEGFGYLDPQALEGVVDVLRSLQDGGRVVGVVSHVEEVKTALPTGIAVTPSPAGSVAVVHYPPE